MNVLVLHAWLKGNLGDVLQLSVLLSAIRELRPRSLDLAGYPPRPAPETAEVTRVADRYLSDHFPWYWGVAPARLGTLLAEPWWRRRRRSLFSRYDAIVCAPGPYLAAYDPRAASALCDIEVAADLRLPVILSSHSIGPLREEGLSAVRRATLHVAREQATHQYLEERGIASVLAADFAFLYPYDVTAATRPAVPVPYRAVFLRSNNLHRHRLRIERGVLLEGDRVLAAASTDRIVLATSDYRRDARFLSGVARSLGTPWVACRTVPELIGLVAGSTGVVSDRYHPAICAAVLGKPAHVIANREPHKMQGLQELLAGKSTEELQALARGGLRRVQQALGRSS